MKQATLRCAALLSVAALAGSLGLATQETKQPAEGGKVAGQAGLVKAYKSGDRRAEAGFVPNKSEAVVGEPLRITFQMKNVGKQEFSYWFGGDYRFTGRHDRFRVRAFDSDGNLQPDPRGDIRGNGITSPRPVKPGQTARHVLRLGDYRTLSKPGEYTVSCSFTVVGGPSPEAPLFTVDTTFRVKLLPRTEENVGRALRALVEEVRRSKDDDLNRLIEGICSFAGERAIPDLVAFTTEKDRWRHVAALGGLARFTTPDAVKTVLRSAQDKDFDVRLAAMRALGQMKTEAAVEGLLARLPHEKTQTSVTVLLRALGETKSARALMPLVVHLEHGDVEVRSAAVRALGTLGGERAVAELRRCAGETDMDRRREAVHALVYRLRQEVQPEWLWPLVRCGGNPQEAIQLLRHQVKKEPARALVRCLDFKEPVPENAVNVGVCRYLDDDFVSARPGMPKVVWHHPAETAAQVAENWTALRRLKQWLVATSKADKGPVAPVRPQPPEQRPAMAPKLAKLIEQLSSKRFTERDAAVRGLEALGDSAMNALLWTAASASDLETRRRAEQLAARVERDWDQRRLEGPAKVISGLALAPDGRVVLCRSRGGMELREVRGGKVLRQFGAPTEPRRAVAVAPDGRHALSGGNPTATLWDLQTGREVRTLSGHAGAVRSVAFSPDGKRAATGSDDATMRIWDVEQGKELKRCMGHEDRVCSVAFAPDGTRVLTASLDGTVHLWDAGSGKELACLRGHREAVWSAVFLPDGQRVLSASCDRTLRLWDVEKGRELRRLVGHTDSVYSVALAPGGRRAVSGGHDGTARLWDLETGKELQRQRLERGWVEQAAFLADGRRVLLAGSADMVRLWELKE
ncbi:MAG: HEAT repeat domain-containing protein [Gemmataceae bacterium]|nr:HEAT repeat domain-containing protein [Gemmataceae bacterium]